MTWADSKLAMRLESMMDLTFPAMAEAAQTSPAIPARVRQHQERYRLRGGE